jgi:pyruvate formate lyase activating enzyme
MLEKAKEVAIAEGLKYVYIGNLGYMDNTYCECGNLLIERGYNMRYANADGIKNSKCIKCRKIIDGVFS